MAKKKKKKVVNVVKAGRSSGKTTDITKISPSKAIEFIAPSTGVSANRPGDKPGEQWVECSCFDCNGSAEKCNLCGEAANACACEVGEFSDCENCKGTGKSRRLVSDDKTKK